MPFISFEGIDGCGKTTQAEILCDKLNSKSILFEYIREPGGTAISEDIRNILLDPENEIMSNTTETLLFLAARSQIVCEKIKPALKQNKWVICDRFTDSTIAYQGYGRKLDVNKLHDLNKYTTQSTFPDVTFFLDISETDAVHRLINSEKDRFEKEDIEFYSRVRYGYLEILKKHSERIHIINGLDSVDIISQTIWDTIKNFGYLDL